jgi:hypothetical protein
MTKNILSKIPHWDRKAESFGVYVSRIKAYAKFMDVGDALDPVLMANCLTNWSLQKLTSRIPPICLLWRCTRHAIIALGQGNSHRIALLGKMKNDDYPNGLAYEFFAKAKKANKPPDVSAMIKLEIELESLHLKVARDFYNAMVGVLDIHGVMKTDHKKYVDGVKES